MTIADEWIEVSCSLFPGATGAPHIPWRPMAGALRGWAEAGLLQASWFVRKMPGLRLRLRGGARQSELEAALAHWLTAAERCNDLRGFRFTRYEPEQYRFGGAAGLSLAHRQFDAGSWAVLDHHVALAAGQARLAPLVWSIANTSDLLQRVLHDRAEIWDVWRRLRDMLPAAEALHETSSAGAGAGLAAAGWSQLLEGLSDTETESVRFAIASNDATAAELSALAECGRLGVGPREWLAAATTFEWNRWGLPGDLPSLARAIDEAAMPWRPDQ